MTERRLEKITIEGFTSIRSATVELRGLNVLVGANGAGKSNFIRGLELLARIVDRDLGYFVGRNGGASALLNDPRFGEIRLRLEAPPNSYEATLGRAANDELIFNEEAAFFHGEGYDTPHKTWLGQGHRETHLHDADRHVARYVTEILKGCRVYHFHDTSIDARVKRTTETADNLALHYDAGNLAAILLALRESDNAAYRRIVGIIRQTAPFFADFELKPEAGDYLRLRWRQRHSDRIFSANQLSDGTLRFICLTTLLLQPKLPALVVLDEPELGLHPYAIVQLADMLHRASIHSQVLIATQSVTLMNQFQADDLIVVNRVDEASTFDRPDPDMLQAWLEEYSLGELWEKNLIGGRPGEARTHG